MADGFHRAECDVCNRKTWHYKERGPQHRPHCTNHSDWNPKKDHAAIHKAVLNSVGMVAQLVTIPQGLAERELREANKLDRSMWENGNRLREISVPLEDAEDLFADEKHLTDPDKLYCSFCKAVVPKISALSEKRPVIRKTQEVYKDSDGKTVIQDKISVRTQEVHACPHHVLQIRKPIVVKTV